MYCGPVALMRVLGRHAQDRIRDIVSRFLPINAPIAAQSPFEGRRFSFFSCFMHDFEALRVSATGVDVCIKRIYEKPVRRDGFRVLVDRIWPRGINKGSAVLDEWLYDIAPSSPLREWFAREPVQWSAFRDRYLVELGSNLLLLDALRESATRQRVTLLYAAKDKKMNHAVVLEETLRTRSLVAGTMECKSRLVEPDDAVPG